MHSITEPLPYTLVLRKIIIYNFLFSVQGPRLLKYIPKSHNFSMWKGNKQNNETCKKNKKENSWIICKYQKMPLNNLCTTHWQERSGCGAWDTVTLCSLNLSREVLRYYSVGWNGTYREGVSSGKEQGREMKIVSC